MGTGKVPCSAAGSSRISRIPGATSSPWNPGPPPPLARDFGEALEKMARLKELEKEFPQLDCGACGAPTCHAFAEDVVRGYGKKEGCIFLQKKQETGEKDR
ncbi:(Fe-S)-binding protein [Acidaminococcus fermentans]|uniref:(Fe-S)-binding protein n=1 Tax=Acidaminococcus fermentans TaxID=905 RepID=UPI0039F60AA3